MARAPCPRPPRASRTRCSRPPARVCCCLAPCEAAAGAARQDTARRENGHRNTHALHRRHEKLRLVLRRLARGAPAGVPAERPARDRAYERLGTVVVSGQDRTGSGRRTLRSLSELMRYGTSVGRCGSMASMQPATGLCTVSDPSDPHMPRSSSTHPPRRRRERGSRSRAGASRRSRACP
jgi:hypothetical protein